MLALDEKEARRLSEVDAFFELLLKSNEPMRLSDEAEALLRRSAASPTRISKAPTRPT